MWVGLSSGVGGVVLGVAARPGSRVGREPPWPSGASWSWSRLLDGDGSLRRLLAAMSLEDEGGKDGTEVVTRPGEVADRSEVADETDVCGEVAASVRGDAEVVGAVEKLVGRVWRGCPVDVAHGMQILTTVVVRGRVRPPRVLGHSASLELVRAGWVNPRHLTTIGPSNWRRGGCWSCGVTDEPLGHTGWWCRWRTAGKVY